MDIAVIGTSVLYPGSTDAQGFWRDILNGKDLITEVPPEQWLSEDYYQPDPAAEDKTYANRGGFLSSIPFDPMEFAIPPADLKAIDMSQLLALVVAKRLLSELKNPISDGLRDRTSVILGMSSTTELILELNSRLQRPIWRKVMEASGLPSDVVGQVEARGASMYPPWREASFPGFLGNVAAGRIANRLDLGGTNLIVDAACASSLAAFHMALLELEAHRADLVVTGGVSTMAEALMYVAFSKTHGLSRSNDCRPFSDQADGTLLGEGIGMFALKRTADAERDGDPVFAVIRGIGSSSDGGGTAIYAPKIEGQQKALKRAYQDAGIDPSTVELIEAHGTGTVAGDAVEYAALASTFAAGPSKMDRRWCALGSIKSQIGHTKAAAGAAGLFKAVMALHHHVLPPTIKISAPNPRLREALSPFYLNTEMRPWLKSADHPRRAGVSAFGFGGTNFHVVLEEYRGNQPRPPKIRSMESEWLAFSADDQGELTLALRQALDQSSEISLDQLAYTWQRRFRAQHRLRLTVVSASPEAFAKTAEHLLDLLDSSRALDDIGWPKGVYFGQGAPSGKMALLFPGQGSQYLNMGRQVSSAFDEMQDVLGRMNASVKSDIPLIDVLYPHSLWTTADRQAATERLADTRWSQRSIGALSAGYVALLRKIGIQPDAVAGHSFGELSALYAANALDETTYSALADVRGRLMAEAAGTAKGGMTAVFASAETVQTVINEHQLQVTLSADNAPQQVVVAGPIPDLGQAEVIFKQKGLRFHRLPVGTAFHTSQVEPAVKPFREALATTPIEVPHCPVYSCVSGLSHRAEPESIKDLLAQQMVSPVQFRQIVQAMYADGVRIFLEVGPRNTLTKLVEGILPDPAVRAVAVDQFDMNGITALWHALAQLSAAGIPIDVERLWESHPPKAVVSSRNSSPATVWINGSNHGKPYPQALTKLAPLNLAIPAAVPEGEKAQLGDWPVPNPRGKAEVTQVVDQFTQALAAYQTLLHDSHAAFLDLAEATTQALAGGGVPLSSGPKSEPSKTAAKPQEPMIMLPPTKGPRLRPGIAVAQAQTILTGMGRAPVVAEADAALHRQAPMPSETEVSAWAQVAAVVAEKTGYPAELLEPSQALEEDLGIDSLKRVEILSALESRLPGLSRQISTARTLGDLVPAGEDLPMSNVSTPSSIDSWGEALDGQVLKSWQVCTYAREASGFGLLSSEFPYPVYLVGGPPAVRESLMASLPGIEVRWVNVTDRLPAEARAVVFLAGLNAFYSETEAIAVNRIAFGLARSLVQHHPDALLVTVQRTGGDFGQTGNGDLGVWASGMTGLVRTLAKEFSQATVKAIDVGPNYTDAETGALVGHELTQGGLEIEVGYSADRTRIVPVLEEHTMEGTEAPLASGSVVLATGGARGVTAAILKAMARERPLKIGILGRTPIEPQTQPPLFDKEAALAWLVQQAKAQGIKYTPQELSRRAQALLAAQEGNQTLDELRALGAEVLYLACDVRDENEVLRAIEAVRQRFGPITAVLHGAGVLRDRRLEDKTDQDFADVFDTKVVGLLALLAHTASDPLTHIAVISSIAASIGNVGQSDYAMANEVLNKVAAREQRLRGDQVAVVAWGLGPWDGGMVDSTIGQYFAEQSIRLIAPESGAKLCIESWQRHLPSTQWVMAMAPKSMRHPRDPRRKQGERRGYWRIQADHFAYLQGHTIEQKVVVPFTVAIGVMVEAARAFHPTASMVQIHDVALLHGILAEKFYQDGDVVEIVAKVIEANAEGADLEQREVEVVLRDARQRPLYKGVVLLGHQLSTKADLGLGESGEMNGAWPYSLDTVYADKMFHKGAFQVIRQLEQFSEQGVSALLEAEQAPWPYQGEPLIWDGGLQLLGLWGHEFLHQRALPTHVKAMHLYRPIKPGETVRCTVWGRKPTSAKLVADIYWSTLKGERVAMMRSAEMHGLGPDTGGWHSPQN